MNKYRKCYERLRKKWEPILISEGVETIPVLPDVFAELIFARDDYEDKSARMTDAEKEEIQRLVENLT